MQIIVYVVIFIVIDNKKRRRILVLGSVMSHPYEQFVPTHN